MPTNEVWKYKFKNFEKFNLLLEKFKFKIKLLKLKIIIKRKTNESF